MDGATRINDEGGAVIVTFALSVLLLLLVTSFAIDVSNFFRHKRQLQTQADAAVLAGASELSATCTSAAPMFASGEMYAGIATASFNRPLAGSEAGTISHDWITDDPCGEGALEIEVTEEDIKWFFPLTAVASFFGEGVDISASARVELKKIAGRGGSLPIAVEDEPSITNAWTWLVDDSGTLVAGTTRRLTEGTGTGDSVPWRTSTPITSENVTQSGLNVRVAIDYNKDSVCQVVDDDCATAAKCSASKVQCFDGESSGGILHIRGFEQLPLLGDTKSPPVLKTVSLEPVAPCVDTAYFNQPGCAYRVVAKVDWVKKILDATNRNTVAKLTGTVGTSPVTLTYDKTTDEWSGTSGTVTSTGFQSVKLAWEMQDGAVSNTATCGDGKGGGKNKNPDPCKGAFDGAAGLGRLDMTLGSAGAVHKVFQSSSAGSGPITYAHATNATVVNNSVTRCLLGVIGCANSWTIEVGLPAKLQFGAHRNLSVKTPGSNDGFLDCDPYHWDPAGPTSGGKPRLIYQLTYGCNGPSFAAAPDSVDDPSECPAVSASSDRGTPWICVATATGDKTGAIDAGLSARIYGTTNPTTLDCTKNPNRMTDGFVSSVPKDDKRVVPVMVVPSGSLAFSGGTFFPVRVFAYFYLTGWDGNSDCGDNESSSTGDILGYFLHHTVPNNGEVFGSEDCDASDPTHLGGCVPVLTE